MRTVDCLVVTDIIARLCEEACLELEADVKAALEDARAIEASLVGKDILGIILQNAAVAEQERIPMCQDTGIVVVFVELGQDVAVTGGSLAEAITEGVRRGYTEGYLRKSVVNDPLRRINTGDNTPPVIHFKVVPGNKLKISVVPKGAGSENMSALKMLKPADGIEGAKKFILETVSAAGPNACPPLTVGVGIGGTMEKAALMAKEALLRPIGTPNPDPQVAALESELLRGINALGIGPMGLGGSVTALAVHVEVFATHIASLPVAVNLNCHAARHKTAII